MSKISKLVFANVWQFCCDFIFVLLSFLVAYAIVSKVVVLSPISKYLWVMFIYVPFWFITMSIAGMYNKTTFYYYDRVFRSVLTATLVAGTAVASLFYMVKSSFFSRRLFTALIVITIVLVLIERYTFQAIYKKYRNTSEKRVLVIGTEEYVERFQYYLNKTQIGMNICGYMQIDKDLPLKYDITGQLEELPELLKNNIYDEILMAMPKEYLEKAEEYVLLCEEMGITVHLLINLYDLKNSKSNISFVGTMPMVTYHTVNLNNLQLFCKRMMDVAGGIVGIIITAVLSIIIVPLIKLDSPGPALFKQDRIGLNGRTFKLYKFRSMRQDAEARKKELMANNKIKDGFMFKVENDPRITRVGRFLRKTSLDELPQFWNVLKGDMSLVGTRPPTPDEVHKYLNGHWRRISIKPGLTGLWQVSGRSSIMDFEEVVKLDTCYIDDWSIKEDIKIILKTVPAVFAKKGAM